MTEAQCEKLELNTPEYALTTSGGINHLAEVKTLQNALAEEPLRRNLDKAIRQIRHMAREADMTNKVGFADIPFPIKGGGIRIDASTASSSNMTPDQIFNIVNGTLVQNASDGHPRYRFIDWVEVLYKDSMGTAQKLTFQVIDGIVVIK